MIVTLKVIMEVRLRAYPPRRGNHGEALGRFGPVRHGTKVDPETAYVDQHHGSF